MRKKITVTLTVEYGNDGAGVNVQFDPPLPDDIVAHATPIIEGLVGAVEKARAAKLAQK